MGPTRSFLSFVCVALVVGACSTEPPSGAARDASDASSVDDLAAPDATPDATSDVASDVTPDAPVDAPPDVADAAPDRARVPRDVPDLEDGGIVGPTYDFVLTDLVVDPPVMGETPDPRTVAAGIAGFNLDGRFTGPAAGDPSECNHGDFFSTLDPDQNMGACAVGMAHGGATCAGGVDNQLPDIANTLGSVGADVRSALHEVVSSGRMTILVRLSGVDGAPGPDLDDDQVTVRVYTVARPMFASCRDVGTPGNPYAVDDASLTVAGDLARARYRFNARIVRGRVMTLSTGSTLDPDLDFALPLGGAAVHLGFFRTQLRFDLSADAAARGNLGGATPLLPITEALRPMIPEGVSPSFVNALLQSFVDMQDPLGDPEGCRLPNGSIGLGMGFTGVRAVIQPATVRGAQPGMCGS